MTMGSGMGGRAALQITSADPAGLLQVLTRAGICLTGVQWLDPLTLRLWVARRDLKHTLLLADRRGAETQVLRETGPGVVIASALKRPVLLAGLLCILALTVFLPTRIFFVQVEGNDLLPQRQILEAARQGGLSFGIPAARVRSEQLKNSLLEQLPQLKWAGVNIRGCVATVQVRERGEGESVPGDEPVSSLVAARDGIIVSCTVTEGSALCSPGQAVRKGQTLISGYTDCGIVVRAQAARGEVMARTRHEFPAVALSAGLQRTQVVDQVKNYSLIIGKKRINFANSSGICGTTCGRMYKEIYITLPGGFQLPIALAVDIHSCCAAEPADADAGQTLQTLRRFCDGYVLSRMIGGSILDSRLTAAASGGVCRVEAEYVCLEMIGRRNQEREAELHGKSN